ncbi:MAG: hypothetical protein WDM81_20810 [Rhizomicrobium sp.]
MAPRRMAEERLGFEEGKEDHRRADRIETGRQRQRGQDRAQARLREARSLQTECGVHVHIIAPARR